MNINFKDTKFIEEVRLFIDNHFNDEINKLRIKYPEYDFAINQIEARRKYSSKFPEIISKKSFLFPSMLSCEQASGENLAKFKLSLVNKSARIADLTSGLGVDSLFFASLCQSIDCFEIDKLKADALEYNAHVFNYENLNVHNCDSIEYLKTHDLKFDIIYVDPSRRSYDGKRINLLKDSLPDIVGNWDLLRSRGRKIIVKASPMIDISNVITTLDGINTIYILCSKGECKEVLAICDESEEMKINIINFFGEEISSEYQVSFLDLSKLGNVQIIEPRDCIEDGYLYEPNSGIMKVGCWDKLCNDFTPLYKLSKNTHLFYSPSLLREFPGRCFKIKNLPDKKFLKNLSGKDVNVISRNYPAKAEQLEQKYRVKSRGNEYLIAGKVGTKEIPVIFYCTKVEI